MSSQVVSSDSPMAMWSPALAELETRSDYRRALTAVVILATIIGAVLRFWNLARLGIIVDEGFMALSVHGILKSGLPIYDNGFAYTRSLPFLYMQAASAWLFGEGPFALRFPAALFGTACIPAAYLMGRTMLGRTMGTVLAVVVAMSLWEIELSRYGRFYTLLQLLWMLAIVFFHGGFIHDRWWARVAFVVTVLVGMWIHMLIVFAGILFLMILPLPGYSLARKAVYVAITGVFVGLRVVFDALTRQMQEHISDIGAQSATGLFASATRLGRNSTNTDALPPFYLPDVARLMDIMQVRQPWLIGLVVLGGVALVVIAIALARKADWRSCLLLGAAAICAVCDQVGAAILLLGVEAALFVRQWSDLRKPPRLAAIVVILIAAAVWMLYAMQVGGRSYRVAFSLLFEFPNLHTFMLQYLVNGWPVMTAGLVVGVIVLAARARRGPWANPAWFTLMALLLPLVAAGIVQSKWTEARYFFHIYPQVALTFCLTPVLIAAWLGRVMRLRGPATIGLLAVVTLGGILVVSQDADPIDSVRIPLRDYGQRRDPIKAVVSWPLHNFYHQDHDGPAAYVRQHIEEGDMVLVVGPQHVGAIYKYYIGQVDYEFAHLNDYPRIVQDAHGKPVDDVADAHILTDLAQVRDVIEPYRTGATGGRGLWIVSDIMLSDPRHWMVLDPEQTYLQDLTATPDYLGRDKRSTVTLVGR